VVVIEQNIRYLQLPLLRAPQWVRLGRTCQFQEDAPIHTHNITPTVSWALSARHVHAFFFLNRTSPQYVRNCFPQATNLRTISIATTRWRNAGVHFFVYDGVRCASDNRSAHAYSSLRGGECFFPGLPRPSQMSNQIVGSQAISKRRIP